MWETCANCGKEGRELALRANPSQNTLRVKKKGGAMVEPPKAPPEGTSSSEGT
jgi:hypothetical protein